MKCATCEDSNLAVQSRRRFIILRSSGYSGSSILMFNFVSASVLKRLANGQYHSDHEI